MFIDDQTFEKLSAESKKMEIGVITVNVVSLKHLVILKIHALKYFQEHRYSKDYNDLIQLLRLNSTNINREELKELCAKYANLVLFEKISSELKG